MIKKIEIFDETSLDLLDMCFAYVSVKVVRKYRGVGSIAITLDSLEKGVKFAVGNYVLFENETYIVNSVHFYKDAMGVIKVDVDGRHINQLLAERILLPNFAEKTDEIAKHYKVAVGEVLSEVGVRMVKECFTNLVAPYNTGGWLKRIADLEIVNHGATIKNTNELLLDAPLMLDVALTELFDESKLGYNIVVDYERKKRIFNVYEPQTKDVFFSEKYGNVSDADFYIMNTDEKTISIYPDDESKTYKFVGITKDGFERKELIGDKNSWDWRVEHKERTSASISALPNDAFVYKVDFDLGDIVHYQAPTFNIRTQQQITEITEQYDTIETIEMVLGDFIPTIYDKLKGAR